MSWQEVVFVDHGCKFILCLQNISYTYFIFLDAVVYRTVIIINTFSVVKGEYPAANKAAFKEAILVL